jgi:hypothetical protein
MSSPRSAAQVPLAARQCGQAATEFVLVSLALAAALCLPWVAGESPASLLLGAVVGLSRAFQHWLSLI